MEERYRGEGMLEAARFLRDVGATFDDVVMRMTMLQIAYSIARMGDNLIHSTKNRIKKA